MVSHFPYTPQESRAQCGKNLTVWLILYSWISTKQWENWIHEYQGPSCCKQYRNRSYSPPMTFLQIIEVDFNKQRFFMARHYNGKKLILKGTDLLTFSPAPFLLFFAVSMSWWSLYTCSQCVSSCQNFLPAISFLVGASPITPYIVSSIVNVCLLEKMFSGIILLI